jgi:hypothetical protein
MSIFVRRTTDNTHSQMYLYLYRIEVLTYLVEWGTCQYTRGLFTRLSYFISRDVKSFSDKHDGTRLRGSATSVFAIQLTLLVGKEAHQPPPEFAETRYSGVSKATNRRQSDHQSATRKREPAVNHSRGEAEAREGVDTGAEQESQFRKRTSRRKRKLLY